MLISISTKKTETIRGLAEEVMEDGEGTETLVEAICDCFSEDQADEISETTEEDLYDIVDSIVDEWDRESPESLLKKLESEMDGHGVEMSFDDEEDEEDGEDDEEEEDEEDEEDDDLDERELDS